MSFARDQKARNWDSWQACLSHPFLSELAAGRLPHESFVFYLTQDIWFRRERAKVLGLAASRAASLDDAAFLGNQVAASHASEHERHRPLAERLGRAIAEADLEPAPVAYAYAAHLRSVALDGDVAAIVAAVLPCLWIYRDFGRAFADHVPADPVYRDWLASYQGSRLDGRLDANRDLLDRSVAAVGAAERARAATAFSISVHYERAFWSMAQHCRDWSDGLPVHPD
jgi:thiaminase/transcriptional activator TenA